MNNLQTAVLEFNQKAGQYVADKAGIDEENYEAFYNQHKFLQEEIAEMMVAIRNGDVVEALDGAVDSLYVLLHFFNMMGFDLDPLFNEVQDSNMSKADPGTGEFIIENGKIQKGSNYRKPDLLSVMKQAEISFFAHIKNKTELTIILDRLERRKSGKEQEEKE